MIRFRQAQHEDVGPVFGLLKDDTLGQTREMDDIALYYAAFDRMLAEGNNHLIVGEDENGCVVATYQITFISGLSLSAARRAQVESVRVASHLRSQGLGHEMFDDVRARAIAAGCSLIQLTMNQSRKDAERFYTGLGFVPSHTGFKLYLDG